MAIATGTEEITNKTRISRISTTAANAKAPPIAPARIAKSTARRTRKETSTNWPTQREEPEAQRRERSRAQQLARCRATSRGRIASNVQPKIEHADEHADEGEDRSDSGIDSAPSPSPVPGGGSSPFDRTTDLRGVGDLRLPFRRVGDVTANRGVALDDEVADRGLDAALDRAGHSQRPGAGEDIATDRATDGERSHAAGHVAADLGIGLDRDRPAEDDDVASDAAGDPDRSAGHPHGAGHLAEHVDRSTTDVQRAVHGPRDGDRSCGDRRVTLDRATDRHRPGTDIEVVVDRFSLADGHGIGAPEVPGRGGGNEREEAEDAEQQGSGEREATHGSLLWRRAMVRFGRRVCQGRIGAGDGGDVDRRPRPGPGRRCRARSPRRPLTVLHLHVADYQPLTDVVTTPGILLGDR